MKWHTERIDSGFSQVESPFLRGLPLDTAGTPSSPHAGELVPESGAWANAPSPGSLPREVEVDAEELGDRFLGAEDEADELDGWPAAEHVEFAAGPGQEQERFEEDICRECGQHYSGGLYSKFDKEGGSSLDGLVGALDSEFTEAESLRQDEFADEAELGLNETLGRADLEDENSADVPAEVASFARSLGSEWSRRRGGSPAQGALTRWLIEDYRETLEGARKRWSARFGKGRFSVEGIGRAWMLSRRENMEFQLETGVKGLRHFEPPRTPASLVSSDLVEDSATSPVAPLVVSFVKELRRRYPSYMRAANYPGHGGGAFNGRGFSLDLYIEGTDDRGFYPKDQAIRFLTAVHEAATAVGAQWRVIYNDFSVAHTVNSALGCQHVIFVGKARKTGARVSGLNWHGPAPLILHFHLDLGQLSGPSSRWLSTNSTGSARGAPHAPAANTGPFIATPSLEHLEHRLLQALQASWEDAGLTPPSFSQLGRMRRGKRGFKRYIASGLFVDDVAAILRNRNRLSITDDDIDMLQRASNAETGGRLSALNSWDSAYMSVGFLQWTLKYAKLQQWIAKAPTAFGRYGIALEDDRRYSFAPSHQEPAIVGAPFARDLRSAEWGARFYFASLDLEAVVVEFQRAVEVGREVRGAIIAPHGSAVAAHYDASPTLRALVQEAHNNRPAYVRQAIRSVAARAAGVETTAFLAMVQKEILHVYQARENAPEKAQRLIDKTKVRRLS